MIIIIVSISFGGDICNLWESGSVIKNKQTNKPKYLTYSAKLSDATISQLWIR